MPISHASSIKFNRGGLGSENSSPDFGGFSNNIGHRKMLNIEEIKDDAISESSQENEDLNLEKSSSLSIEKEMKKSNAENSPKVGGLGEIKKLRVRRKSELVEEDLVDIRRLDDMSEIENAEIQSRHQSFANFSHDDNLSNLVLKNTKDNLMEVKEMGR